MAALTLSNKLINPSNGQTGNQSIDQSINQSINQLINDHQSIRLPELLFVRVDGHVNLGWAVLKAQGLQLILVFFLVTKDR